MSSARLYGMFVLGGVMLVAAALAVYIPYVWQTSRAEQARTDGNWSLIVPAVSVRDHVIGNRNAQVQVIVYGDFACKYCREFFESTMPALQQKYGDRIMFAFRHYPVFPKATAPQAFMEAQVSECLYNQKGDTAFFNYMRAIYADSRYESGLSTSTALSMAESAGGDPNTLRSCVQNGATSAMVRDETIQASIAGLNLNPSSVIKSQHRAMVVPGDYLVRFTSAIDYMFATESAITNNYKSH